MRQINNILCVKLNLHEAEWAVEFGSWQMGPSAGSLTALAEITPLHFATMVIAITTFRYSRVLSNNLSDPG